VTAGAVSNSQHHRHSPARRGLLHAIFVDAGDAVGSAARAPGCPSLRARDRHIEEAVLGARCRTGSSPCSAVSRSR
jgi:hypothetical protein